MLKITNFTKTYYGAKVKAVDNISFEAYNGEILGFLGPNGSGKSTTIKSIVGILPFDSGTIEIENIDLKKQPLLAKKLIGFVPDNHAMFERLTGREYINHMANLYDVSLEDLKTRCDYYLKVFELTKVIDHPIKSYSQGMKQKISTIAALIHNPKILILDEPLTNLDPQSALKLKKLMRRHANEGNIVFFSSHILDVVENLCDRICIIKNGVIKGVYKVDELRKEKGDLEKLFMSIVYDASAEEEDLI